MNAVSIRYLLHPFSVARRSPASNTAHQSLSHRACDAPGERSATGARSLCPAIVLQCLGHNTRRYLVPELCPVTVMAENRGVACRHFGAERLAEVHKLHVLALGD